MVTKVLTIEEEIELVRLEERQEGRQEGREEGVPKGKALNLIELLVDGDISYKKAKQKLDKLRASSPDSDFWVDIYKSLNDLNPHSSAVNEPIAEYKTKSKKKSP